MNTLEHRWQIRQREIVKTHVRKHARKYVDFIVSGQPLSDIFQTNHEMISMLGWITDVGYEGRIIKEFLKEEPAELETGRTIIYGCSECGDIGCGAITAEILDLGDKIVWRDFGYENNYAGFSLEEYKHIGQFEFDKAEYKNEFDKIAKELANTPRHKDEMQQ